MYSELEKGRQGLRSWAWMPSVALLAMLVVVVHSDFSRLSARLDARRFVIFSGRPPTADQPLVNALGSEGRIGYFRMDSKYSHDLLPQIGVPKNVRDAGGLILVTNPPPSSEEISWSVDSAEIDEAFALAARSSASAPIVAYAGVFGSLMGLLIVFSGTALRAVLLGAALAAVYKSITQCETCAVAELAGVDASLVGAWTYLALAFVLSPRRELRLLVSAICSMALLWQSSQIFLGMDTCLPCSAIAAANGCVAFSLVWHAARVGALRLSGSIAVLGVGAAVFGGSLVPKQVTNDASMSKRVGAAPPLLAGQALIDLGAPADLKGPATVLIGVSECEPCARAELALSAEPDLNLSILELQRDRPGGIGIATDPQHLVRSTPTILSVDGSGRIVSDFRGWSESAEWRSAVVDQLRQDLRRARGSDEEKYKENTHGH